MESILLAAVAITPAGWAFVATLFVISGIVLIAFTTGIPVINVITSAIGWGLIMLAGFIGIYGLFPEQSMLIFRITFTVIWIAAVVVVIYSYYKLVRKME